MELSGAEIVVQSLKDEGVEYVFGYPGGSVLHIYDAFFKQQDVKHILVTFSLITLDSLSVHLKLMTS